MRSPGPHEVEQCRNLLAKMGLECVTPVIRVVTTAQDVGESRLSVREIHRTAARWQPPSNLLQLNSMDVRNVTFDAIAEACWRVAT